MNIRKFKPIGVTPANDCGLSASRSFWRSRNGNISIIFMFMSTVLFLFIGGAVDFSRWNSVRTDMVQSMDAAALAVARLSSSNPDIEDEDLAEFGEKFFYENFNYEDYVEDFELVFDFENDAVIGTCVEGRLDTYLLRVAGIPHFDVDKCVEITKKGSGRVELALVLDVTGSMKNTVDGVKKIVSLRDAVDTMLDVMFEEDQESENLKIGIVPFNSYVNPGGADSWSSSWEDTDAVSYFHGIRFLHVGEDGEVDMTRRVNLFNLHDSVSGGGWKGCVEARVYPLDELDVPPGGSITISELVEEFEMPDEYTGEDTTPEEDRMNEAFTNIKLPITPTNELTDSDNFNWTPLFAEDGLDCNANWNGRCPSSSGYSYWSETEDYLIEGVPHSQEFWRSWFVDPSYDGQTENDYYNRNFLDDEDYIGRYSGEPAGRYAKIVEDFQNLGKTPYGSLTPQQKAWYNYMTALGVVDFYDSDITSPTDSSTADSQEYILRQAYIGWWDSANQIYDYKYDQSPYIDESLSDSDSSTTGPNRNCPEAILPLTNQRQDIEDHMDGLFPNGNTNTAIGSIWGWRILSPDAPFTEGVGEEDPEYGKWQKAIVIMTDGENTVANRDTHWGSDLTSYGYALESRMGVGMTDPDDMEDQYDDKMLRICHRMKKEGYLVYTIMFGLDSDDTEQLFKACATEPNEPYFHDAADGDDLQDAFGDIAADLVELHVSQ